MVIRFLFCVSVCFVLFISNSKTITAVLTDAKNGNTVTGSSMREYSHSPEKFRSARFPPKKSIENEKP